VKEGNNSLSQKVIYTIGHSTHSVDQFVQLLIRNSITAIADVRSVPYSKFQPQFNREGLKNELKNHDIKYVFLGVELGARSKDQACYINGKVQYRLLAKTENFRKGIERLKKGMERFLIAVMCSEREPLECHRAILVSRELEAAGVSVIHIHADGHYEKHSELISRLLKLQELSNKDLFKNSSELIEDAYAKQENKIAYIDEKSVEEEGGEN
jgi:uncharacterized protein (DUF488 family)